VATWGILHRHEELVVGDNTYNYGYLTRKPVEYDARKEDLRSDPALDPNHSHFILVDGKGSKFGQEIELRGLFEACARRPKGNMKELAVRQHLKNSMLGWEGCEVSPRPPFKRERAAVFTRSANTASSFLGFLGDLQGQCI
jgi:hypothetical protein